MKLRVGGIEKLPEGKHHDGGGLYLRVRKRGRKHWVYEYRARGVRRTKTLGKWPDISVTEARQIHRENAKVVRQGIDPFLVPWDNMLEVGLVRAVELAWAEVCDEVNSRRSDGWLKFLLYLQRLEWRVGGKILDDQFHLVRLPVVMTGRLMQVDKMTISRWNRQAVERGILSVVKLESRLGHKARVYQVNLERLEEQIAVAEGRLTG